MKKKYTKRYIQFNDLVFDHVDMITADDASVSFKRNDTEYTYRHGDYSPHRSRALLAKSYTFSMTIRLSMKKLPCEHRRFYINFAISELAKVGRLWAVRGDELLWAWAELDKFSEREDSARDELELDVDVYLPEGIWHKADLQKTFLLPWDVCDFMECAGFKEPDPCECCDCTDTVDAGCCCECVERDMALCYHKDELQKAYTCAGIGYRVSYDCESAERLFDSMTYQLGQKMCTDTGVIAGQLQYNGDLPSDYVKIRFHGHVKNVRIDINGNINVIEGEYDDLIIYPDGTVAYGGDCGGVASVSAWRIPSGNTYGWELYPGPNRVVIDTQDCCDTVCAYFELDPITL